MAPNPDFALGISGFQFSDLFKSDRLRDLHEAFWIYTETTSPGLRAKFLQVADLPPSPPQSEVLIEVGRYTGDFLARLFQVTTEVSKIRNATEELNPAFRFRNEFLKIRVFKRFEEAVLPTTEFAALEKTVRDIQNQEPAPPGADPEVRLARVTLFLLDCHKKLKKEPLTRVEEMRAQSLCSPILGGALEDKISLALERIETWCTQVWIDPKKRRGVDGWVSYIRPGKLDFANLIPTVPGPSGLDQDRVVAHTRPRDGFQLTDTRMPTKRMLREIDYCIYCHQREKDSCSKGFPEKGGFKKNPLGIELKGCPLDERISEMQWLRKQGDPLGALAMIMLDNPMCPGTGHRICNDCMKGCIFQKQEPVNIPENETAVLTEVLGLPYGVEIYGLLTRFNPLNHKRPYALPYHGNDILIVGLGPAGYTLSHYLANEGFGVVGVDGLKLEPLDDRLTGKGRPFPEPIKNFSELHEELDQRVLKGFGGVSEYGITVRWDKNFLGLIYLTLLRRQNVRFYGGVRFGGTLTLEEAWDLGFKHVALATGAGRPTLVDMKNNLSRGVRKASDLLMSLQLSGAFKSNSLSNLQVQLPSLVIGGGLTALDTATETLAYYPVQVEKILSQFEKLKLELGEEAVWKLCDAEEQTTLKTFLDHGLAVRTERRAAKKEKRKPRFADLCKQWGGVQVVYRKALSDSPAYRLNHEEVAKALEEGVGFIEKMTPLEVVLDEHQAVAALLCRTSEGKEVRLPARSISVAAGTQPNTTYEKEFPGTFEMDAQGKYFKKYRITEQGDSLVRVPSAPGEKGAFFLSAESAGRMVSFYGDNHPDYAGNVVKAMASAKHGAPEVAKLFATDIAHATHGTSGDKRFSTLTDKLDSALHPKVVRVNRLAPTIVEVIVHAPLAARKFQPGQFYRLQNFETQAHATNGYRLTMEGLALTGAWVDKEKELLSLVVLEMGASSRMCALLQPGEPVVVMGPTGTPSDIPKNETVLLAGGGLGNAVLLSIAQAMRANGCRVIYFAGYKKAADVFFHDLIQSSTDQMIWAVDEGETIPVGRPGDLTYRGNIVQAMTAYARGELQKVPLFPFSQIDRVLAIGSDRMMAAVGAARSKELAPYLNPAHVAIGSINSPMQCMMKEICAQCLQKHVDPKTGEESFVFSCFNQDQLLDEVDFTNLRARLRTNSLAEKVTATLVDRLLAQSKVEKV